MKYFLYIALCLATLSVSAQKGFFVQATGGIGPGNARLYATPAGREKTDFAFTYNTQVVAGYQFDSLVISTGIGYMRTGFSYYDSKLDQNRLPNVSYYQSHLFQNQIMAPVMLGRRYHKNEKTSWTPAIGIYIAYNYSSTGTAYTYNAAGITSIFDTKVSDDLHRANFRQVSCFAAAQLKFSCRVVPRLSIVSFPSLVFGLDNIRNRHPQWPAKTQQYWKYPNQHNYTYNLNIGMQWSFAKAKKSASIETK